MKKIILFLSIAVASGLLFTNIYNSVVDARSWGSNFPGSIETARAYYKSANPGDFYRIFSPLNQLLGLVVLIIFWKRSKQVRVLLGAAFVVYVIADLMTFAYFYPRNEIMFSSSITDMETIKNAWLQWTSMNWVRSLVCVTGIVFSFLGLNKVCSG